MSSSLSVEPADLAQLLARHAGDRAAGFRCTVADGALEVEIRGLQAPAPLPPFDLVLEVRGGLAPGPLPVVVLEVRARSLPFGLQVLANPWMTVLLERILPPDLRAACTLEPPSTVRLDLSRFAPTAGWVGPVVRVTALSIPSEDGAALRAAFAAVPPLSPQGRDAA